MAQNSQRIQWSSEEVDAHLKKIMADCFEQCLKTALTYTEQKEGVLPSLVTGANIAGYVKVAEAMAQLGDVW
jgi:glutamate dehydrogenase (NADP+)